jgi:hypothetical protein
MLRHSFPGGHGKTARSDQLNDIHAGDETNAPASSVAARPGIGSLRRPIQRNRETCDLPSHAAGLLSRLAVTSAPSSGRSSRRTESPPSTRPDPSRDRYGLGRPTVRDASHASTSLRR